MQERKDPSPAILINDLRKDYGATHAVNGISFTVNKGEIFGLIGPDGAGKTTTFQILAGVMEATSGVAQIFGEPARSMRSQTGYLTQTFSLYPDLSVNENIRYIGDLRRVPPEKIVERGRRYLEMFDMDRFADRLAGQLSGGMKQKLALACALVPEPRVLLLDEPTTGVDPVSRREFWDALAHLSAEGLTILVATPYLDEAERCHTVALTYEGKIHLSGAPAELRQTLHAKRLELRTSEIREAEKIIIDLSGPEHEILDAQRFGDRFDLLAHEPERAKQIVSERLHEAHIPFDEIRVDEPTLENTFVATLCNLGEQAHEVPFPRRHDHSHLRGQTAIGAHQLIKTFGSFTAVNDVSLKIKYGEVYGLLGANGAGKTTTIKMLCGLLEPTHGQIQLAGESSEFRSAGVRMRIWLHVAEVFAL